MSNNTVQSPQLAWIESIARQLPKDAQEDFRNFGRSIMDNLTALSPGGNLVQPGGPQTGGAAAPTGVTFSVAGGSGVLTATFNDPSTAKPGTIWHEVSYCSLASFVGGQTTTLPATTAATLTIPASGVSAFVRMRTSYDRKTWSAYQLASTTAIDAGLVESTAMSPAAAFNQTNFSSVNSTASGTSAAVTVSGTGGTLTPYAAVRGTQQAIRPSATIVGVTPQSQQFVGWDSKTFQLKPTLASVLADGLEPVGAVSVVSTAVPTLPTIVPIVSGGGIVGFDVTNGGAGASQPYTLTISDSDPIPGAGATAGEQTIRNGVLISVAPGNAGHGYHAGTTTVTAAGGTGGGTSGGGTALGGNGGRLTNV